MNKTELKIKTPYGLKNWNYLKSLMDNDIKKENENFNIKINGININTKELK